MNVTTIRILVIVLGLCQLFWLYRAWRNGGWLAVVNLIAYSILVGVTVQLGDWLKTPG